MSNVANDSRSTSDGHILVRQIESDSIADDQQLEVLQCLTVLSDGSTEGSTMTIKIEEQVDDESADDGNIIISNTFTAVTLADGTQAFVAQDVSVDVEQNEEVQLADLSEDGAVIVQHLPKFLEGHAIQLEDGTTAILPTGVKEGRFQQVELEDGSTAFVCLPEAFVTCIPEKQDDEQHSEPVEQEEQQDQLSPSQSEARNKCFMCTHEGCGKYYTTLHHLKVHERAHTGDRPFRCTVSGCNKAFATGYGRKAHIRTHTGEKPYRCPEESCGKGFKTSGDLQKHLRTHTGERPFHCPVIGCNRSFTTSNIRKVHIRTHTGERPYVCTEEGCVRAFASATNYKNHLRIHSGEKPYVCSVKECGKRFTEYSSLYKHHMVHTQMKPYLCTICSRHYRQASTLTMHKRTAHGIVEADDGTEIFFGDRVLELANTGSSSSNKKLKTLNSNFLGFRKDGNTLVAVQTSDDSAGLQSFQGTTGRLVFVADSDLERYGLEVKDCIEEQTCQIEFADDESSNSIIT